ncbi:hypothetical protein [Roseiconus lacunae]|uniref:hypothetical protein n=1 Tax=Roseiconus lacunae TaxID=2605694 RepID=UPI001E308E8E|nr:hypothetical protein [Roseiconus lacunae]MCD0459215.1 hypothetical protein [Roseiconus lacunae]
MNESEPTDLQLRLAERLEIENPSGMTRRQLSSIFEKMLDPAFDDYEGLIHEKIESAIEEINPDCQYALTLYQRGKKTIVDVLQFDGIQYDDRNRIYIECVVPVIDRTDGPAHYVPEWGDKSVDLTIDKILFFRELPADFPDQCQAVFSMDHYRKTIDWGKSLVRSILGVEPDTNPIANLTERERIAIEREANQVATAVSRTQPNVERRSTGCLVLLIGFGSCVWFGATSVI